MPLQGFRVVPQSIADWDRFFRGVPVQPDPNSVGEMQLQDASVIEAKLAAASVSVDKIAAEAVNASKLAAAAVTEAKLAAAAVTEAKLATDAVTTIKIQAAAVTTEKMAAANADGKFLVRRAGAMTYDTLVDADIPAAIARDTEVTAAIAALNLASGTYTPTLTNVANLDGSTAFQCQYTRVGSVVTVSGKVSIDPTLAATSTQLGISLPIASNFGAEEDCAGTAVAPGIAGQCSAIKADTTNDRAQLQFVSGDLTNQPMFMTFSYRII